METKLLTLVQIPRLRKKAGGGNWHLMMDMTTKFMTCVMFAHHAGYNVQDAAEIKVKTVKRLIALTLSSYSSLVSPSLLMSCFRSMSSLNG